MYKPKYGQDKSKT